MIIKGKLLNAFSRALDPKDEQYDHVHVTPTGLQGWRDTTEGPFRIQLSGTIDGVQFDGEECVPIKYMKRLCKIAGARNSVEIHCTEPAALATKIKGTSYRTSLAHRAQPPDRSDQAESRTWRMSSADFRRGGAITVAAFYAAKDDARPGLHAVHLDAVVTGTDGSQLNQRKPATNLTGLDALVPLPAVQGVLRMVQATLPESVEGVRTPGWIRFRADGWEVSSPLLPAEHKPDYDKATAQGDGAATMIAVDAADLRQLWMPFRRQDFYLAVYPDGLLVWADHESGIGTTLERIPTTEPAIVFGKAVIPGLAKVLPKSGKLAMAVAGPMDPARIAGQVVMGASVDVPEFVRDDLSVAFGEPAETAEAA